MFIDIQKEEIPEFEERYINDFIGNISEDYCKM